MKSGTEVTLKLSPNVFGSFNDNDDTEFEYNKSTSFKFS